MAKDSIWSAEYRAQEAERNGNSREAEAIRRDIATATPEERRSEGYKQDEYPGPGRRIVDNPTNLAPQDGDWYFDGHGNTIEF